MSKRYRLTEEQEALASKLNHKQKMFVLHYVRGDLSQREAYKEAGYASTNDNAIDACASKLLRTAKVKKFYESLIESIQSNAIMTREEALERLSRFGRGSLKAMTDFKSIEVGRDDDGAKVYQSTWAFKDSDEIPEDHADCISELSTTNHGLKLKLHDPMNAIAQLAKMQGWEAPKKIEHGGVVGSIDMSIDSGTSPQKASEIYMDVMRGITSDES